MFGYEQPTKFHQFIYRKMINISYFCYFAKICTKHRAANVLSYSKNVKLLYSKYVTKLQSQEVAYIDNFKVIATALRAVRTILLLIFISAVTLPL